MRNRFIYLTAVAMAIVLPLAAANAPAADGPYVTAGYGYSGYQTRCDGVCEKRDSGFRIAGGWRLASSWSVEALYLKPGTFEASDMTATGVSFYGRAHVRAVGGDVGYDYWLGTSFSLGARAGLASVKADFTPGPAPAISGGKTTAQFLGGLNATWHFSSAWSARLDWDHTRARMNRYSGDVNLVSLGAQFGF